MNKSYWYYCLTFIKFPPPLFLSVDMISYITSSVIESENNLFPLMQVKKLVGKDYDEMKMNITCAIQISKEDFDGYKDMCKSR